MSKKSAYFILFIFLIFFITGEFLHAQETSAQPSNAAETQIITKPISIKTIYGKFYAYIVLLFNENPHFVNLIEKDSIPLEALSQEGFHIKEYREYLNSLKNSALYPMAKILYSIYSEPSKYDDATLQIMEKNLAQKFIILKFSRDKIDGGKKINLDYCIYGEKNLIYVKHPFFKINEKIYNIQPFIYYDEFSTSNSTFYFDMIYINPVEVDNDYIIAKKIINDLRVDSLFFVGSPVTEDIKYCLKRAFSDKKVIKNSIWEMFVIHELTHKILNNRYNSFDQVTGETLSLHSTIYTNANLGLAVMYSYLNYNKINPHRIAAMKYINYIAETTNRKELTENVGLIKYIPENELKSITKEHFDVIIGNYKVYENQQ